MHKPCLNFSTIALNITQRFRNMEETKKATFKHDFIFFRFFLNSFSSQTTNETKVCRSSAFGFISLEKFFASRSGKRWTTRWPWSNLRKPKRSTLSQKMNLLLQCSKKLQCYLKKISFLKSQVPEWKISIWYFCCRKDIKLISKTPSCTFNVLV